MTTTALTWFYAKPEKNAYALAERVRTTLWEARLGGIWLDTVRAEPPYLMRGRYGESEVEMEWEAGKWLALRARPAAPFLAERMAVVLRFKPAMTYEDADGWTVWEWHLDGGEKRWQAIQGIPAYKQPQRLTPA
jgi:hypothetical protein